MVNLFLTIWERARMFPKMLYNFTFPPAVCEGPSFLSLCVLLCLTLCNPMTCTMPGSFTLHYFLEFPQIHVHWQWCYLSLSSSATPLLLLPSIFPSIRVFSNESALHIRWPKYWSFSCSINPSNEYSGLISFRMDCFDLLAVQGTLKSLLQHHSSKAWILWCSAFFIVQLSHPYMTIGKTIALTRQTFVGKVMSLLFNTLSRFVIAFLPRSKHLNVMVSVTVHSDFGAQEKNLSLFPLFPHLFAME